jgi:methyl-accepting chemotaxis protein
VRPRSYPARIATRLRTVRLRLTALYGALVLASGAGLLAIVNVLARNWRWHGLNVNTPVSLMVAESAIALGIMAVVSLALGWRVAGHVLRPLQQMTATARAISEDNLDARLAVPGPRDELKDLGDTIDALLARLQAVRHPAPVRRQRLP